MIFGNLCYDCTTSRVAKQMNFAKSKIWDKDIAISALGRIEGLFDYMRIRGDMTRMLS